MLVPSMTLEEIKKEIAKDFPIVFRKSEYLAQDLKRSLKHTHFEKEVRFYDYLSKYKNNWIIRIEEQKKGSMVTFITWYYNEAGLTAIIPVENNDYLSFFTAGFFKSFNERMQLNLTLPNDIIRAYADENLINGDVKLGYCAKGIYKFYCSTPHGYVLGTCNEYEKFYKLHAFMTHEMLKGREGELEKVMNEEVERFVEKT